MKSHGQLYDLIVIGGGPSGMIMAGRASELGARVLLLEKNKRLGKKLSISGGGRCNITNAEFNTREFLSNFPESKEFLYSPFSQFGVKETISFFEKEGLPIVIESRKRAFPKSQKATDVVAMLERYIKKKNVEVKTGESVIGLVAENGGTFIVKTKKSSYETKKVAVAAGGTAAPETGSTGEGFRLLKKLGHTIRKPNPNIVPLKSTAKWIHKLSGTTLSFMTIRFRQDDKVRIKKTGKILFTHFGLSGPLILNSSYEVVKLMKESKSTIFASIDMFPDTNEKELNRRLWRLFEKNKNKMLKNTLLDLIPENIAAGVILFVDKNLFDRKVHSITKEERGALVKRMKDMTLTITGTLGPDKAVAADGGVPLEEVNFKNMTSRIHPNLYLLGDTLDVNRPSGGYSLQLCWTTGYVAGTDAGEQFQKK